MNTRLRLPSPTSSTDTILSASIRDPTAGTDFKYPGIVSVVRNSYGASFTGIPFVASHYLKTRNITSLLPRQGEGEHQRYQQHQSLNHVLRVIREAFNSQPRKDDPD